MRLTRTILGFAAVACFTLTPAYADHGPKSTAKPTTIHGQSPADQTATTAGKQKTKATRSTTSTTSKTSTKGNGTQSKTVQKSKTSSTTSTTPTTKLNPIAAKISSKRNLNAKISAMLPTVNGKTMSLNEASKGFRNQGQFIAALHASQRLDCGTASCFKLIKADMVDKHMSLGQSIQDVKHTSPAAASSDATRAEHEAEHDLGDHDDHHDWRHREESEHERRDSDHKEFGHGNKLAKEISRNPQLNAKVSTLLPAGMTLKKAAKGFTSERQFLSALHAAKDLGIPFAQLKAEMTGHDHDSLTQAIRELKPGVNARAAAKTAQQEASADLRSTQTNTDH